MSLSDGFLRTDTVGVSAKGKDTFSAHACARTASFLCVCVRWRVCRADVRGRRSESALVDAGHGLVVLVLQLQ